MRQKGRYVTDTAIGYIRVSTDEQAQDGVSLDVQRKRLEQYAELYDIELTTIIEDAGVSAKTLKRDGLQMALTMLRQGRGPISSQARPSDAQRERSRHTDRGLLRQVPTSVRGGPH